jgi:hypothetical protein
MKFPAEEFSLFPLDPIICRQTAARVRRPFGVPFPPAVEKADPAQTARRPPRESLHARAR